MTDAPEPTKPDWERQLDALLPLFGHRNWIAVVDSAYPAQARQGIETVLSGADQLEVARKVADAIAASRHVRAHVYIDRELAFVPEKDAPGIAVYHKQLGQIFGASAIELPHQEIIAKLDRAAQVFRVLILKTQMTIPYTSIFFELDCGYWKADAEERMRQAIAASETK